MNDFKEVYYRWWVMQEALEMFQKQLIYYTPAIDNLIKQYELEADIPIIIKGKETT